MNGSHPVRAIVLGLAVLAGCVASSDDALPSGDASESGGTDDDGDDGPVTSSADAGDDDGDGDDGPDPMTSSGAAEAETSESGGGDASTNAGGIDSSGDGAMDDGGSIECAALMECCEQLGADIYTGCATVVDLAMPALCDSTLSTYHQEGYCTGETFCADLGACCDELPPGDGWQDTCTYYADLGNQPQCAMLIGDYQLSGYCF